MKNGEWLDNNFDRLMDNKEFRAKVKSGLKGIHETGDEILDDMYFQFYAMFILQAIDEHLLNSEFMLEGETRIVNNTESNRRKVRASGRVVQNRHQLYPDKHEKYSFKRTQLNELFFFTRNYNE